MSLRSKNSGAISLLVVLVIAIAGAFAYVRGPAVVAAIKGDNRKVEKLQQKQDQVEHQIDTKQLEVVKDAHGDVAAVNAILNSSATAERKVEEAKPFAQKADDKLTQVDGGLSFQERKYFQDLVVRLMSENAQVAATAKTEIEKRDAKSSELSGQLTELHVKKDKVDSELRTATDNLQASEAKYRAEAERAQFWFRLVVVAGVVMVAFNYILPLFPQLAPVVDLYHKLVNPIFHKQPPAA